ncbi:hypothetical protein NLJ89_g10342 [Agrocybe chaxingu]|uniref:Gfo/Idh/MocA-like oxidoreductase N-terminal domain-containing protein n=1 Tax=Agrocybe chaxingu TaxID=84603 RepID=A0A9W8MSQ5_9AGAR|nr:hypothetical protein NLJ89_g10342 [Agrocybe chaxingu]
MPLSAPLKVGFVGLSSSGWASDVLAPALLDASLRSKYDLVAVSTTSPTSADASAKLYSEKVGHPIKSYHGDTSQIANDPDVNLVAVSVKAQFHKQAILPVIEAGKDFFLEWPAGSSVKETQAIAEAARKKGVKSIVGLQGRHSRTIAKVKELLASGTIGPLRSTHVFAHIGREVTSWPPLVREKASYTAEKKNGVTRLDVPIGHQLDTFTYLLGDFTSLTAIDATLYPTGTLVDDDGKPTGKTFPSETPDHFVISGVLSSGLVANLFYRGGYASGPETGRRQYVWEIDGEDGTIRLESDYLYGAFTNIFEPKLYLNGKEVAVEGAGPVGSLDSVTTAWREFAEGHGKFATIEDALKNRRLLDAIERSAKEGKRVSL